jgi:hypothetical protein
MHKTRRKIRFPSGLIIDAEITSVNPSPRRGVVQPAFEPYAVAGRCRDYHWLIACMFSTGYQRKINRVNTRFNEDGTGINETGEYHRAANSNLQCR